MRRLELELSVERDLPGEEGVAPARARLAVRFTYDGDEKGPSPSELSDALAGLRRDLALAAGVSAEVAPPRRERALPELIGTYRPRQAELVELLFEEGELSAEEHRLLVEYLGKNPASASTAAPSRIPAATADSSARPIPPIAAAPSQSEVGAGRTRPVPELLQTYQILSLKQAGAVRARRQISFEEYMALKRHFGPAESAPVTPDPPPPTP